MTPLVRTDFDGHVVFVFTQGGGLRLFSLLTDICVHINERSRAYCHPFASTAEFPRKFEEFSNFYKHYWVTFYSKFVLPFIVILRFPTLKYS